MSAPTEANVAELFEQLESQSIAARSREGMIADLISLHEEVGSRYAEHAYMALSSDPAFIDHSMAEDDVGVRLKSDLDALLNGATRVREARDANDEETRLLAEARLTQAYFRRHNEICIRACLVAKGGRA